MYDNEHGSTDMQLTFLDHVSNQTNMKVMGRCSFQTRDKINETKNKKILEIK